MSGQPRWGAGLLVVSMVLGALATVPATPAVAKQPRPDLVVSKVTVTPGQVTGDRTLRVTETTRNKGRRAAKRSVTRYYLSKNKKVDGKDVRLGQRKVKRLKPRSRHGVRKRLLKVPLVVAPGRYRLLACSDASGKVREGNERNNCRVAKRRVTVPVVKMGGPMVPYNGSVGVSVLLTAEHRRWDDSDTPGNAFEHQEETSIHYTGGGLGWLVVKNGKLDSLTWQWSRANASGAVTYTAQGEGTGIAECPLWTAEGSVTSPGSAISTASTAGMISTDSSTAGLAVDIGLEHPDMGSIEVDKMACGEVYGPDRTLRLALKQYWWAKEPEITLGWSPDLSTVTYRKRSTVNDPSYSEQGWEEKGTLQLTPMFPIP